MSANGCTYQTRVGRTLKQTSSRFTLRVEGPTRVSRTQAYKAVTRCEASSSEDLTRRAILSTGVTAGAASILTKSTPASAKVVSSKWEAVSVQKIVPVLKNFDLKREKRRLYSMKKVKLPVDDEIVLLDVGFTGTDPKHGFLLGTRQTLLETFDGGKTWEKRSLQGAIDEGFNYRFNSISFNGDEGWIVGKPAIVLHTGNGGQSWERIPLSSKLPGGPILITALPGAAGQAEMTTDQGAIYVTDNTAFTWRAAVQETVDATLNRTVSSGISGASYYEGFFSNVKRSIQSGEYVAVSSRGNFYMTWAPGDTYWQPHNRPAGRRVQNMGWTLDNRLWSTSRGGEFYLTTEPGLSDDFQQGRLGSRGFGILDVGFRDKEEGFAVGGSGSLFVTEDGGKSWKRDKSADQIPANLYAVKFTDSSQGFILGNNGVLLRYIG